MKSKYIKGFTLVELLVVITILAILFTVGFISFKNYVKDARDGGRVADISNVTNGLEISNVKLGKYPDPDKKDGQSLLQTGALSISGSIIEYSYLGVIGDSVTRQLSLTKVPTDPLTGDKYIYTKTIDGRKYQVASILENPTGYKNDLVKQASAGNDGYVAKVEGNHKDIVIQQTSSGKFITVVPSLVFDPSGSNILNQTGTLSIVNNKGNLPYSPSKSSSIGNTTNAEQLIKEIRNNNLATTATLKLPDGVTLDGSGVLNEWWIPNKNGTNWNTYSSGVILASLGSVGVNGNPNYDLLTAVLNGKNPLPETTTAQVVTAPSYDVGNSLRFNGSDQYLSRTPSVAGNRQKWTFSTWFKRGVSTYGALFSFGSAYPGGALNFNNDVLRYREYNGSSYNANLYTSMVFRDYSKWYNIVLSFDSTASNSYDRVVLYVDGIRVNSFSAPVYPSKDYSSYFNQANLNTIGGGMGAGYFNGYMSDINFIDSGALLPTDFGQFDTNGRWVPKSYTGSYGANGFHLDFSSGASLTSLGLDSSGKGNNWTLSSTFNTYDQMLDSPTNNFATLNPVDIVSYTSLFKGNLNIKYTGSTSTLGGGSRGTIGFSSGYWEWEVTISGGSSYVIGIRDSSIKLNNSPNSDMMLGVRGYYGYNGNKNNNGSNSSYGGTFGPGDRIKVRYNNGDLEFFKNEVSQGIAFTGLNGTLWLPFIYLDDYGTAPDVDFNFGQGGQTGLKYCSEAGGYFKYCPPAGFKALSTKNITYPIENPKQYFDVLTYTGNNLVRSLTGLNFQPDLVWIKGINLTSNHRIYDSVRGPEKYLSSSYVSVPELTHTGSVTSFNSDGFSVGTDPNSGVNENTYRYVAWNWRAGGTSVTNNDGTIQSQVSVNKEAGFSIVSYTGNNVSGATVGHGLTKVPNFIIWKDRDAITNWRVYHSSIGVSGGADISTNGSFGAGQVAWTTAPTSSGFTISGGNTNGNLQKHIAYVWSEVPGYSKFGSYVGNNTIDGPFIYTGFKPKYLMIKNSTTGGTSGYDWVIYDSARNQYNPVTNTLWADLSVTENNSSYSPKNGPNGNGDIDFLSNGFKIRSSASSMGGSDTYIYAAFAELPFK